jgi:hypothetical protein
MELQNCLNTTDSPNRNFDDHDAKDFVWATSEQAKLHALSLFLIRSIVESHGGTITVDLATDTINIDVPEEEQVICAQEIEEQVGAMCC